MKKNIYLFAIILTMVVLTACGGSNKVHDSHDDHKEHNDHAIGHVQETEDNQASYALKTSFNGAAEGVRVGEELEMTIQITGQNGNPVEKFQVNHEKLLHLIIVNHDLSYFNHIHPEFKGSGRFVVSTAFPTGGKYKIFADFVPDDGKSTTLSEWVEVQGNEGVHTIISADQELIKIVDQKRVDLTLSSMKSQEEIIFTFNISDAKTLKGIDDLEAYLGAVGHVVIISADTEQYLHVHPLDKFSTGPMARFAATFPQSGLYKVWGQFQHKGTVFTVPFTIDVESSSSQ